MPAALVQPHHAMPMPVALRAAHWHLLPPLAPHPVRAAIAGGAVARGSLVHSWVLVTSQRSGCDVMARRDLVEVAW